jgi:hypothetical protein
MDEAHASHVGCQRIDFLDALSGPAAVLRDPQVEPQKLVGVRWGELGYLRSTPRTQ